MVHFVIVVHTVQALKKQKSPLSLKLLASRQPSRADNAWYLDRKAWILYRIKRYEESIETWQRAARLKPGHKALRRNIDMAAREANPAPPLKG